MYRVLLVDDEYLDLLGLERLVPWQQYNMEIVAAVKNGFEAVSILQQQQIDLLVTDIRMPNMSGLELAERARELQARLKIIFVSGYQDFQYARQAIEMHANSYVLKPVDDKELFQQLSLVRGELDQEYERKRREELLQKLLRFHPQAKETVTSEQKKPSRNHKLIQEIETYVIEHLSTDFTLRDIAQQFGFSPNYLGYLFKEEIGETFTEYVIRKRLEHAVELLRDPKLKLYEIAYRLGYSNLTYFGRQFKEAFGQTPGEYRRNLY